MDSKKEEQKNYDKELYKSFERKGALVEPKLNNLCLEEEQTCGDHHIKIYREKDGAMGQLKIFKKDKELYSEDGFKFRIGLIYDDMPEDKLVRGCKDITGNGEPNLIVSEWSGGAHCCFTFRVFSLGDGFKQIGFIDGGDGDYSKFIDVDHDGALEFVGRDWTFAYWNTCFAGSPAPEVILKYRNGEYRLAMDLMKKPLPTPDEEKRIIKAIDTQKEELQEDFKEEIKVSGKESADPINIAWVRDDVFIPPLVWGHMLDLIYSGHAQEVEKFLDKIWPQGKQHKKEFLAEFKEKLADSSYCSSLNEFYGECFSILCNANPPNFGDSGLKELFKRQYFKELKEDQK